MSARVVHLGFAVFAASWVLSVIQARPADASEPIRFEYRAPAECPTEAQFIERVRERSLHQRLAADGELARAFVVTVTVGEGSSTARVDSPGARFRDQAHRHERGFHPAGSRSVRGGVLPEYDRRNLSNTERMVFEEWITTQNGGFAGVHSATDTANGWRFYKELTGQYYDLHEMCCSQANIQWDQAALNHPTVRGLPSPWTRSEEW